MRTFVFGLAVLVWIPGAWPAASQDQPRRKLAVVTFDQQAVQSNLREVFEQDNVNVGLSVARLVARHLADAGWEIVELPGALPWGSSAEAVAAAGRSVGADAVLAGTVLVFGSGSATAGVSGPRVGGVRVGIGRRTTTAAVALESRLVDVASGTMLGVFPGTATESRSGVGLFARVPGLIDGDGFIDMTMPEFSRTLLGEVTTSAVGQLTAGVTEARGQVGSIAAPVAEAPSPAMPAISAPPSGAPVVGTYTGGAFAWTPWQFQGTEQFQYTIQQVENGDRQNGTYELGFTPVGDGRVRMRVNGRLGEESYSSTVTTRFEGQQSGIGYQELAALGPAGILLFNPAAWIMMWGRELSIGDEWSHSSGGESLSIRVDRECTYAGQRGALIVMRENNQVRMESCVSPDVPLPLRMLTDDGDNQWEMTLVSFTR
jgi:hypothetical protein